MSTRTRAAMAAAAAAATSLATSAVLAAPASAATTSPGSVLNQSAPGMSPGMALLIFAGIPLCVVALVWLLVSAPGWTRSGRPDDTEAWTGEAVVVGARGEATSIESSEAAESQPVAEDAGTTGGTSAGW